MARLIAFEDSGLDGLRPLLLLRTLFELRLGRKILLDRLAKGLGMSVGGVWTRAALAGVAGDACATSVNEPARAGDLLANGRWVCPENVTPEAAPCVAYVGEMPAYVHCDEKLAARLSPEVMLDAERLGEALKDVPRVQAGGWELRWLWDLIRRNNETLHQDFKGHHAGVEADVPSEALEGPPDMLHIGVDTRIHRRAVINCVDGPVYIGEKVQIGPCAVIEGPIYIGPKTIISPHAWLHGGNSIGPVCKIGGEVAGCVIHGFTNKVHAGFLGHSYVGSWVNLGAGTTNSNLKNTYGHVRVTMDGRSIDTEGRFFGAMIGDHVKTGIQSIIPTGANLGAASVLATGGVIPKEVPPLTWLTDAGLERGDIKRLAEVACIAMSRRDVTFSDAERELFLGLAKQA